MKTKQILIGAAIIGGAFYLYNRSKNTPKTPTVESQEAAPIEEKGKSDASTSIKDKAASVKGANTKVLKINMSKRKPMNPNSLRGRLFARRKSIQVQNATDLDASTQDNADENASFAFNGIVF